MYEDDDPNDKESILSEAHVDAIIDRRPFASWAEIAEIDNLFYSVFEMRAGLRLLDGAFVD